MIYFGKKSYLIDFIFMIFHNIRGLKTVYISAIPLKKDYWCIHYNLTDTVNKQILIQNYQDRKAFIASYKGFSISI
nr:hypothetical protein [Bacillus cereus]